MSKSMMENDDGSIKWDTTLELNSDMFKMYGACTLVDYLGEKSDSIMNGKVSYTAEMSLDNQDELLMTLTFDVGFDKGKVKHFKLFLDNDIMEHGKKELEFIINDKKYVFDDYAQVRNVLSITEKLVSH